MKAFHFVVCLSAWGLASLPVHAEEKRPGFSISYAEAGLTSITVKDGTLHYMWRTDQQYDEDDRPSPAADVDVVTAYDRHEVELLLTRKETARFQDWIDRNKVFDFREKDKSESPIIRAAFDSGLTVVQGDKKYGIGMGGDSKTLEKLGTAVGELIKLADEIQKSRNR